ncbi:MAG TPA: hypothetical protein VMF88_07610 [Bacteroidota bacterium]|nr:hypothetical protein [Bacteroidota bacterium]
MASLDDRLRDISEIRFMMEQSSKFLSLSGLSGVSTGLVGIAAAAAAQWMVDSAGRGGAATGMTVYFLAGSAVTLIVALLLAVYFSVRMARKKELPLWSSTTRSLLFNLFIPLAAGGFFCLILLYHDLPLLIAPSMLIFYGLALLNASKYTLREIRYLGMSEIVLGLTASVWLSFGLILWGIGFGVLHIVYGTIMYIKYEK